MKDPNQESWIQTQWRPLLAIAYIVIILFDFVIGPVFWTFAQALFSGQVTQSWIPLTLEGGGLFHVGMSAILGVSAFTRGNEKAALRNRRDSHDGNSNRGNPDE